MPLEEFWIVGPGGDRYIGYSKITKAGDHVKPNAYERIGGFASPPVQLSEGQWLPTVDIPNVGPIYEFQTKGPNSMPSARNKAWGKLVDSIRTGPASLGISLGEFGQSLDMVTARSRQMYRGYKALRRGDFRAFSKELGMKPKRKHKNLIKSKAGQASSLWLEYSFGWKPLVTDVYNGVTAVGQPVPSGRCQGSGVQILDYVFDGNPYSEHFQGIGICKQGANVFISNPNTYALQQLGLANPAVIAWELVPFSFLVDWVFDVSSSLGALTDLLGCDVQDAYTTSFYKGKGTTSWNDYGTLVSRNANIHGMKRELGLSQPLPNTSYTANIGKSLTRAANAVSLLGQILTK